MAVTRHTYAATREIRVSTLPPGVMFRRSPRDVRGTMIGTKRRATSLRDVLRRLRVETQNAPNLPSIVRSWTKCLPEPDHFGCVGCSKHEVTHAQYFSQVPAVSKCTGVPAVSKCTANFAFPRQSPPQPGPLTPAAIGDARGDESRLRRRSARRHHRQHRAQQH